MPSIFTSPRFFRAPPRQFANAFPALLLVLVLCSLDWDAWMAVIEETVGAAIRYAKLVIK